MSSRRGRRAPLVGTLLAGLVLPGLAASPARAAGVDPEPVIRVNFQDESAFTPQGYEKDYGQAFDAGRGYGWVHMDSHQPLSLVGNGRLRPDALDQRRATLMHMQLAPHAGEGVSTPGRWELAVPAGTYRVELEVGDFDHLDSVHRVVVEGQEAIKGFKPTDDERFARAVVKVKVDDGRLTVSPAGGTNTKIDYVVVERVGGQAAPPSTAKPTPPTTAKPTPPTTAKPAPPPSTAKPATPPSTAKPAPPTPAKPTPPTTAKPNPPSTAPTGGASGNTQPAARWAASSAWDALGVFTQGGKKDVDNMERWLGRTVNFRLVWAGWQNWQPTMAAFKKLTHPRTGHVANNDRTLIIAMGLTMKQGSQGATQARAKLQAAANGANDAFWREIGKVLHERGLDGRFPDGRPKVILRVGWESNGDWYPWSSQGNEELFAKAFRRAHDRVSERAPNMTWIYGLSVNKSNEASVRKAYPGDAYVDIIEMDVYDSWAAYPQSGGGDRNPGARQRSWEMKLNGNVGLNFLARFAQERGKLLAIGETGLWRQNVGGRAGEVGGGDNPQWIDNIHNWANTQARAGRLGWLNYFEANTNSTKHALRGNSSNRGATAGSQFPKAAARFLQVFGG